MSKKKFSLLDGLAALVKNVRDMHPGDDFIEVMHGHHCCKKDCWHYTMRPGTPDGTCTCYGLGSSHAGDCPAWKNGRAEEERKKYG